MLTEEDGYNALAALVLAGQSKIPIYRLAPRHGYSIPAVEEAAAVTLFSPPLTHDDLARRHESGSRATTTAADGAIPTGSDLLFLIHGGKDLRPVTTSDTPSPEPGDTAVLLGPS
jgi:hypothetical protein